MKANGQILMASQVKELSVMGGLLVDVESLGSASVAGKWGRESIASYYTRQNL